MASLNNPNQAYSLQDTIPGLTDFLTPYAFWKVGGGMEMGFKTLVLTKIWVRALSFMSLFKPVSFLKSLLSVLSISRHLL